MRRVRIFFFVFLRILSYVIIRISRMNERIFPYKEHL